MSGSTDSGDAELDDILHDAAVMINNPDYHQDGSIAILKTMLAARERRIAAEAQNEIIGYVYRELGEHNIADKMKRYQLTKLKGDES
jgi:hypothetical protein